MKYKYLFFLGLFSLMPSFAANQNLPTLKPKQQLEATDANRILVITPEQDEIEIFLPSNPSTGYVWAVKDFDRRLLKLTDHFVIKTETKRVGAPNLELFEFKLLKGNRGREANQLTEITFVQLRSFETVKEQAQNQEVTFKVMIYAD